MILLKVIFGEVLVKWKHIASNTLITLQVLQGVKRFKSSRPDHFPRYSLIKDIPLVVQTFHWMPSLGSAFSFTLAIPLSAV
jgi:hypothetical protein